MVRSNVLIWINCLHIFCSCFSIIFSCLWTISFKRCIRRKTPVSRKNITDKVLEALTSPDVLNKIIPVLSEKIGETISTLIESEIQACIVLGFLDEFLTRSFFYEEIQVQLRVHLLPTTDL
jgi:hypothetical protein